MMPERAGDIVASGDGGVRLGCAWGIVLVCVDGVPGDGGVRLGRVVTLVPGRACCVVLEAVDCLVPGRVVVTVRAGCFGLGRVGVVVRVGVVGRDVGTDGRDAGGVVVRAGGRGCGRGAGRGADFGGGFGWYWARPIGANIRKTMKITSRGPRDISDFITYSPDLQVAAPGFTGLS